jgi:non-specific serine/threonine protein kinase/serine/threonine-protein kinase
LAISAALVLLLTVTGLTAVIREARIAAVERARAERRFNDVRNLATSLMFDIHDAIKDLPGSTAARKLLVTRALDYLDNLAREARSDSSLQRELAAAYDRIARVQGDPYTANLGDTSGALASYAKAVAIRETILKSNPADSETEWNLYDNYIGMAACLEIQNDFPQASVNARKAAALSERLSRQPHNPETGDRGAGAFYYLGNILVETGHLAEALESYQKAAEISKSVQPRDPGQVRKAQMHLAGDYSGIARVLETQKKFGPAIQAHQQAALLLEGLSAADPNNATIRGYLADSYQFLGSDWKENGDLNDGLRYLRRALEIYAALASADPANVLISYRLGYTEMAIGEALLKQGDYSHGRQSLSDSSALFQRLVAAHPENGFSRRGLADATAALGRARLLTRSREHVQ